MSKSTGNFFSFLLGSLTGFVGGVLFAPDKGSNTRDKLTYQLDKYRERLSELIEELKDGRDLPASTARSEGQKVITNAKDKAEQLLSDVDELIGQIKEQETN